MVQQTARILALMLSPRAKGNTEFMLTQAVSAAQEVPGVTVDMWRLPGKKIGNCISCHRCRESGTCYQQDDFEELLQAWLAADGLLYGAPVYHYGIPGSAKNALDKLAHVMFAKFNRRLPRFTKVGGALAQGSSRYGGQEHAIAQLVNSLLLMNCLPIAGDTPGSYTGAAGFAPTWEKGSIEQDAASLETARSLGRRVAEVVLLVAAGKRALGEQLPLEYRVLELNG